MNKVFSLIALAFLGCGSAVAQQVNASNVQRPKLVVGIVVDQMRWDYLYRYQKRYEKVDSSDCSTRASLARTPEFRMFHRLQPSVILVSIQAVCHLSTGSPETIS